ncbi:hypothetical protein L1987_12131 [Smallanthus sonchifolius]|uniref:Uncharacterized protein n=1 Tax=Smallanthus sonchifolius TaxID=185202 RepID=A0ACB9JDU0_9ASTR|nr:hypothetical protein L1987_12131 [Smallanthus sonchifolius]
MLKHPPYKETHLPFSAISVIFLLNTNNITSRTLKHISHLLKLGQAGQQVQVLFYHHIKHIFHLLYVGRSSESSSFTLSTRKRIRFSVIKMKITGSSNMGRSKKRVSSKLGGILKEQKARLYIIRRCVVMLLCYHD